MPSRVRRTPDVTAVVAQHGDSRERMRELWPVSKELSSDCYAGFRLDARKNRGTVQQPFPGVPPRLPRHKMASPQDPGISLAPSAAETQVDQDTPACTPQPAPHQLPRERAKGQSFPSPQAGEKYKKANFLLVFFFRGTGFLLHLQNYFQRVLSTFSSHLSKTEYLL